MTWLERFGLCLLMGYGGTRILMDLMGIFA